MIDASLVTLGLVASTLFTLGLIGWLRPAQPARVKIKGRRYL